MVVRFVTLMAIPFIFLSRDGRRQIGLTTGFRARWILWGLLSGALAAVAVGLLGHLLFARSANNWYVTVGATILSDPRLKSLPAAMLLPALAIPAALFSPVGEELFFRGVFHESIAGHAGHGVAAVITGCAFGLMHVFHHGISTGPGGVNVRVVSGLLWVLLTLGLSLMFNACRRRSGSIWPAVVCHTAFNVTMVGFIVGTLGAVRD
jgi:membrane protease YdiL (CAAX protease family)